MNTYTNLTKWLSRWGTLPLLLISLFVGKQALPYERVQQDKCKILDEYDGADGRRSITLRHALDYARKAKRTEQRCRHEINIGTPTINLDKPLVIDIQNITKNNVPARTDGTPEYMLQGMDNETLTTLNASSVTPGKNSDPVKDCVITFRNTNNITLKNIRLEKVPEGMSGICFENTVNGIWLDNVHVSQVKGGHGIVFAEGAFNNVIFPGSSFKNIVGGSAIKILGSDVSNLQNFNQLHATNREATGTGRDGLATFGEAIDGVEKNISLFTILSGEYVSSASPIRIRVDRIREQGTQGVFRISGMIVEGGTEADLCGAPRKTGAAGVTRLQIYSIRPRSTTTPANRTNDTDSESQTLEEGKFYSYVMPRDLSRGAGGGGNGIDTQGSTQGRFDFEINTRDTGANMIVILPELSTHSIGGSSRIVVVQRNDTGDCGGAGLSGETGGGAASGGAFGTYRRYLTSIEECRQERGIDAFGRPTRSLDPEIDSDRDGLPDVLEDLNGTCSCRDGDISCWDNPDSDGDGIPDSLEVPLAKINTSRIVEGSVEYVANEPLCTGTVVVANGRDVDVCDVDEDGISNALDKDSDNDSWFDYVEDRKRAFVATRKAHYYEYQAGQTSDLTEYRDKDGKLVGCDEELTGDKLDVGVSFGIYRVKRNPSERGVPNKQPISSSLQKSQAALEADGETLVALACRNIAVREASNFNGVKDGQAESNPYDQSDGECRGGVKNANDVCVLSCEPRETLNAIIVSPEEEEAYFDLMNGERRALKKTVGENGRMVEKIFTLEPQIIKGLCSDIDDDDIPDCIELPSGSCEDLRVNSGKNLSPYTKDSDNDTKPDASDPCPTDGQNSCNQISEPPYKDRKVLAYFIDRDGDGLKDGTEDKNQDTFITKVGGLAGRETTETDPLNADSDGDGLGDYIEVISWNRYTNPADPDTDFDGLADNLEVKNEAESPRDKSYISPDGVGCATFKPLAPGTDPDPTQPFGTDPAKADTDSDGVSDFVEIQGVGNLLSGGSSIQGEISSEDLVSKLLEGIDIASNPLSKDSDGDGLSDGDEYGADGVMTYPDSNPCDQNTDNDSKKDGDESQQCRSNTDERCTGESAGGFFDRDGDGLSDFIEAKLGTDPNVRDSDTDGLDDGAEDINHDGTIQTNQGETNPLAADTDDDGLRDSFERQFGADPNNTDTDRDGLLDGVEIINQNSLDTDPTNPDTDGDGLCDGGRAVNFAGPAGNITCIRGEDINENGVVDKDPKNPNQVIETDPRNPDSDSDGELDKDEICHGGSCNIAGNLGRATQGKSEGCFSVSGQHSGSNRAPTSMIYLLGLLLIGNRFMARAKQRQKENA